LSTQLQRTESALVAERDAHTIARETLQQARVTLSQLEERVAGLTARLVEQEAHSVSLEQKHTQAREALEHFRTASKEQRDQEHRRHEHQVQGLQVEVRNTAEALAAKNHELLQLNREAVRLTEQVGQLQKDLQQAIAFGRQRKDELDQLAPVRNELQTLKARWTQDQQSIERANREIAEHQAELIREREARSQAEAHAAAANGRLAAMEAVFSKWKIPSIHTAEAPTSGL
jgi:chromosome segregation ATPase